MNYKPQKQNTMKQQFLFLVLTILSTLCFSQHLSAQENKRPQLTFEQRAEKQAKAVAENLLLSDKSSAEFTQIYTAYLKEMYDCKQARRKANSQYKDNKKNNHELTDEQILESIQGQFDYSRKMLDIREKYFKKLKGKLTAKQLQRVFSGMHPQYRAPKHPAAPKKKHAEKQHRKHFNKKEK